ncbi:MAG: MobA/MobL family protein [Fusobacterium sp.]|nr:MobA/MobL family protein [Fusobacterium sp.]
MSIFNFHISNSKSVTKKNIKASEHYNYISRAEQYSPKSSNEVTREQEIQSALSHLEYVQRKNAFSHHDDYEDLVVSKDNNMPSWAEENPAVFWIASEKYERANGRTYTEFLISLPHELSDKENENLIDTFCKDTFGKSFVYSYGIHSKPSSVEEIQNIHCHLMFCERKLDGIYREPEQFFKRYNSKYPERGGAGKDRFWNRADMFKITRKNWERILNKELEARGLEKVSAETLEFQRLEAITAGDILKAEFLDRPAINCDSRVMMKYNKYGEDSLTTLEKEEYELFLIAKEIRDIKKENYNELKNSNHIEKCKYIGKNLIRDRAKYAIHKAKSQNKEMDKFNYFEQAKEQLPFAFAGNGILLEEYNNDKFDAEINKAFLDTFEIKENQFIKNEVSSDLEMPSLYKDYKPNIDIISMYPDIIKNLEKDRKKLESDKRTLVSNIKTSIIKFELPYYEEAVFNISAKGIKSDELTNIRELYNKKNLIEKELNDKSIFKKFFKNEKEEIEKRKEIEEINDKLFELYKYEISKELQKELFIEKFNILKREEKNNPEIFEKHQSSMNFMINDYVKIKEEIEINKTGSRYASDEYSRYSKEIEKEEDKLRPLKNKIETLIYSVASLKEKGSYNMNNDKLKVYRLRDLIKEEKIESNSILFDKVCTSILKDAVKKQDFYKEAIESDLNVASKDFIVNFEVIKNLEKLINKEKTLSNLVKEIDNLKENEVYKFNKASEPKIEIKKEEKEIESKEKESILKYLAACSMLDENIYSQEKTKELLLNEDRLLNIAQKSNISMEKVVLKYRRKLSDLTLDTEDLNQKVKVSKTALNDLELNPSFIKNCEEIKSDLLKERKILFAKIDKAKLLKQNANDLFTSSREITSKLKKIEEILENKENTKEAKKVIDTTDSLIEKNTNKKKEIKSESKFIPKKATSRKKDIPESNNSSPIFGIKIPKKKRKGLVDEEDGIVKEYGDER